MDPTLYFPSGSSRLPGHHIIWLLVLEYLTEQRDLSNISLCSKQLYTIAVRQRWTKVSLRSTDESLGSILRPGLAPTQYIRQLELLCDHKKNSKLGLIIDHLAQVLPEDTLRSVT